MKKALLTLLLLFPLVACATNKTVVTFTLNAVSHGHFSDIQAEYLAREDFSDTTPFNGNLSVSKPEPINITWDCNIEATYFVGIYKDEACTDLAVKYQTQEKSLDLYNSLFNQDYYIKVSTVENNGTVHSSEAVHVREDIKVAGPRNVYVEGVENFRDIGGWGYFENGEYRTYMKQGMIYRSGRFNEEKVDVVTPSITENGLYEVKNHLKIKTEIDLRRTSTNEVGALTDKSVLGDDVNYIQLPMAYGGNNILTFKGKLSNDDYEYDNPEMIKRFFEILADEKNYPINFHCSIGKDRTGCLAYLVEGLVVGNKEIMYRDYMFTNFADAGMCKLTDVTSRYGKTISDYSASGTFLENETYAYLLEVVVIPDLTLKKVINILRA